MKKFTLLLLLFVTPFIMNAQSWDFNGDDGGWTPSGSTIATGAEFLTLTCTDAANNPALGQLSAGIPTADVHIIGVTLRNNHANGPTYMRISYLKPAGGRVYKNLDISNGNTEFVTHFFDLTNANWTGTMDDIKIHFKGDGGIDFTGTGAETIDFDKIELLNAYPITEKHVYNFDTEGDAENWTTVNGTIDAVTGGILTFSPIANKYAKFEQHMHYVVADDYNWCRVKVKNNSTGDNEIVLITSLGRANIAITTSDATEQTYEILLDTLGVGASGTTTWTGNAEDMVLRFGDATTGMSTGTGSFEINSIEFYAACVMDIYSDAVTTATVGEAYSYQVVGTVCDGSYSLASTPDASAWLSIDAVTGLVSGTPTVDGDVNVTITISNGTTDATQDYTLVVSPACQMEITSNAVTTATVGEAYSYQVTGTVCDGTFSIASTPDASAWLSIDAATGLVSGTPTVAGDVNVTITLSDGTTDITQDYTLVISPACQMEITSSAVTTATVGEAYSYQVTGTVCDGSYSLASTPDASAWLSIDAATGLVSGTPTEDGDVNVTITLSDGTTDITQDYTLVISPACQMEITSDAVTTAQVGEAYSYQVTGTVCDGTYSISTTPDASAWLSIDTATGLVSGTPTENGDVNVTITLSDGTTDITQDYTLVVSPPTSVNSNNLKAINIYPNPASDVFNITNANGSQLSIFDITGKRLFSQIITSDNASINTSELQKGIYIVSVKDGVSSKILKVVVE